MKYYRITKMVVEYVEAETEGEALEIFFEAESKMEDSISVEEVSKNSMKVRQIEYWSFSSPSENRIILNPFLAEAKEI